MWRQSLTNKGCIRKARQLTCCLAALWGNDFAGSVFARRHLMKLISDGLLRQRNGLMIYNKIERVLVITKQIFNYYNTNFSLEITSKVQNISQKYTFTHKLTTKRNFQTTSLFFSSTVTEWNAQDCGISKAAKNTCCLQNSIRRRYHRRQEVKQNLNLDVPCCLSAFWSFWTQPKANPIYNSSRVLFITRDKLTTCVVILSAKLNGHLWLHWSHLRKLVWISF